MPGNPSFLESLQHGWNAFRNKDPSDIFNNNGVQLGPSSSYRPDRNRLTYSSDGTFINSVINRIAVDTSLVMFEHIKVDENDAYLSTVDSGLNNILTLEANTDQSANDFIIDLVTSLLDEGCVACVPIDTVSPPIGGVGSYDVLTMRTGRIVNWYPDRVTVEVFNEMSGNKQNVTVPKNMVAIIENPFYSVMNSPNSTLKRLTRRMSLLDVADEKMVSPKLDMLIQMPYAINKTIRQNQAQSRMDEITGQLESSKYGIAYVDGTEKVIQLNRPVENTLVPQIEYLTKLLFSQLGLTPEIMNGTANEQAMTNYNRRVIDAICNKITLEFNRKFITKTARSQGQTIWSHRQPFAFTTTTTIADVADKFTRNEILSPNDVRQVIGYKPVQDDGKSDELRNRNIATVNYPGYGQPDGSQMGTNQQGFDQQPYGDLTIDQYSSGQQ